MLAIAESAEQVETETHVESGGASLILFVSALVIGSLKIVTLAHH